MSPHVVARGLPFAVAVAVSLALPGCKSDATSAGDASSAGDVPKDAAPDVGGAKEASSGTPDTSPDGADGPPASKRIDTVYVISLENTDWNSQNTEAVGLYVSKNPAAPFINSTLLPKYAHAEEYHTPFHPSEPNYLAYETGGDSLGVTSSPLPFRYNGGCHEPVAGAPKDGSQDCGDGFFRAPPGTQHVTKILHEANISWKYYFGAIPGNGALCPNTDTTAGYSGDHDANIFFDDVVTSDVAALTLRPETLTYCRDHLRPLAELLTDLKAGNESRYNFIIPTDQDQGEKCPVSGQNCTAADKMKHMDGSLMALVTGIWSNSPAWKAGTAVLFIVWDEPDFNNDTDASGLIVVSPKVKQPGLASMTRFANGHASLVKTVLEIFALPPIGKAALAATPDLGEMFASFP